MAASVVNEKIPEHSMNGSPALSATSTMDSLEKQSMETDRVDLEAGIGGSALKPALTRTQQLTNTLSKTLSKVRTRDDLEPGPPPDGGFQGWLTAWLTHLVLFNTWGFIQSFGLFQTYYVDVAKIGNNSEVAWIGSAQVFVLFFMGSFTGRAVDGGFFRITFITGNVISVFGFFMLSLCKTYWQVFLAQTLCIGFGYGCVFVPSMTLLSTYFAKKRPIALGIAVCGSATGGLVFPAIAETMLPKYGFGWTIRVMAFVQMVIAIGCSIFMKPRLSPRKSGPLFEWSAFRELPYSLYLCSAFFFFWSVYIGFFFVGSFGANVIGTSHATSINLLMVMNGIGVLGRILPSVLAVRTGPLNMMIPIVVCTAAIGYSWLAVKDTVGLWAFAVAYGIFGAGIQGLFPVVLTSLTTDPKKMGTRTGMGFAICGFAVLTGPPIAGALVQLQNGRYTGVQVYAGTCMLLSAAFLVATRWSKVGWTAGKV